MELPKFRQFDSPWRLVSKFLLMGLPLLIIVYVLDVQVYLGIPLMQAQFLGLAFAFSLGAVFLMVPATRSASRKQLPWYDILGVISSFLVGGYVAVFYSAFLINPQPNTIRNALAIISFIVVIEAVRRLFGWTLFGLSIFFILFGLFGNAIGLHPTPLRWQQWLTLLYLSEQALLGAPFWAIIIIVLPFILFGQLLFGTGGGDAFNKFAIAVAGKRQGGPAKVAVVSSCLFGMFSGAPSANAAATGIFTIPLMKRVGYKPEFAGAVEAAASSGGSFMPPIMSVCAFLIAEFLTIPYIEVVIAATIPAFLYYITLFVQVHEEAVAKGLKGLLAVEIPPVRETLREMWIFILPVGVIFYALMILRTPPQVGAIYGIGGMLFLSLLNKKIMRRMKSLPTVIEDVGRILMELATIGAYAGIVAGVITFTNLGINFSRIIIGLSQGNVILLSVMVAVVSLILGMGLPIIASYILLAFLLAPALIQLGVLPIAAHLFILFYATASYLTPPVCMAVFVVTSIAGSDFLKTAIASMRLGMGMYILPFVFILNTALLMKGSPSEIVMSALFNLVGMVSIAMAASGYLWGDKLFKTKRIILTTGGVMLLIPSIKFEIVGLLIFILLNLKASFLLGGRKNLWPD